MHHVAISVRSRQGTVLTGLVGHRVLQLLQRYGDNCAAGDVVQGPSSLFFIQIFDFKLSRFCTISYGGAEFVGLNTLNVISRRNRFNRQSDICAIQLLIVIFDNIIIAANDACKVMGAVIQIAKGDIFRSIHDLAVQEDPNLDLGARMPNLLPDGIQGIDAALVVDNIAFPSLKFSRRRTGIRRPAQELIPIPSKAKVLSRLQFHGFVVGNIHRLGSAYAAVGMINQGGSRSLVAPDRIEGDNVADSISSLDLHLIARVIGSTTAVVLRVPVQENCVFNVAAVLDVSIAVFLVELVVRGGSSTNAIQVILHAEYFIADKVRIDGSIHMDLLIHVEGNKGTIRILRGPAVEGVAFTVINLRQFVRVNHTAQRNFQNSGITRSVHGYVNGDLHFRRCPLSVQNQVARRHGGTFEHKLRPIQASLSSVPTLEFKQRINSTGAGWDEIGPADISFVLVGIRLYSHIIIVKFKLIRVSCVIEPNIVVAIAPRPVILFFTCICESKNVFCIPIGSLIVHSLVIERAIIIFTVQPLQHIVQLIFSCITLPLCCVGCGGTIGFTADQVRRKVQAF